MGMSLGMASLVVCIFYYPPIPPLLPLLFCADAGYCGLYLSRLKGSCFDGGCGGGVVFDIMGEGVCDWWLLLQRSINTI